MLVLNINQKNEEKKYIYKIKSLTGYFEKNRKKLKPDDDLQNTQCRIDKSSAKDTFMRDEPSFAIDRHRQYAGDNNCKQYQQHNPFVSEPRFLFTNKTGNCPYTFRLCFKVFTITRPRGMTICIR